MSKCYYSRNGLCENIYGLHEPCSGNSTGCRFYYGGVKLQETIENLVRGYKAALGIKPDGGIR